MDETAAQPADTPVAGNLGTQAAPAPETAGEAPEQGSVHVRAVVGCLGLGAGVEGDLPNDAEVQACIREGLLVEL